MDEFLVGGFAENEHGRRSLKIKQLVLLAVKKVINKKVNTSIGKACGKVIENASAGPLKPFLSKK